LQPRREAREANEQEAQAIAILEQLVAARPDQDAFRFELAAALLPRPGPEPGPVDASKLPVAVAHAEELVARQPRHPEYLGLAGRAHGALAMAKLAASDLPAAEAEIRAAIVHESALLRGKQRNERFLMQLVRSGMLLARVLTASGQGARIDTELQPVVAVLVQVAADEGLTLDPTTLQGAFTALPEARPRGPRELPRALQELHNKLRRR
jgi:hypothetical protein